MPIPKDCENVYGTSWCIGCGRQRECYAGNSEQESEEDTEYTRYNDGNWYASTLGHFISLLVDAGHDPAVLFRVVEDEKPDEDGHFVRHLEVVMIPNGHEIGRAHV